MAAKPVVLPELFTGEGSWEEWRFHFDNVAVVNGWRDEQKLQWLKVRLTGRAQKAFQRLSDEAKRTFDGATAALKERFEPQSRKTRYQAEFQARRKKPNEGWADIAEDLQALVDKAYPDLQPAEAREQLAINAYLQQLTPLQVAFGVKQKSPQTVDDAVATTLQMESFLPQTTHVQSRESAVSELLPLNPEQQESEATISTVIPGPMEKLTRLVEQLSEKVETLQLETARMRQFRRGAGRGRGRGRNDTRLGFSGDCWNCGKPGHTARNCREERRQPGQGNGNPSVN